MTFLINCKVILH